MLGAVFGDIIGSVYEAGCTKDYNFNMFMQGSRFTDDTVLTCAVCDAILYNDSDVTILTRSRREKEYAQRFKAFYARYPYAGYGGMFISWANEKELSVSKSYGNGAAMRIVPVGYAYKTIEQVCKQAEASCAYTHGNREAIAGAKAVVAAVFLALHGYDKAEIKKYIIKSFKYSFDIPVDELRFNYTFSSRTGESVPQAILCFLESESYEDAVRKAVSLGGDADTMACIAGGIAEAYYKEIPNDIRFFCMERLDSTMRDTFAKFSKKYVPFYKE